ncbi:MAG: carbohydrate porin, partial [Phycisphaerales bacterium]
MRTAMFERVGGLAAALVLSGVAPAEPVEKLEGEAAGIPEAEEILQRRQVEHPLFTFDPLAPVSGWADRGRDALQPLGVSFELAVTSVLQIAGDSISSRPPVLWSFSYDFCGEWELLRSSSIGIGHLGWHLEGGRPIGDRRTTDLSADIGSMLGINDDLDAEPVALTELWWEHEALDGALTITLGKIDPTYFYDGNRIANCEVTQFFATPLVNNAAVAFPDNGLGVNVTITPVDWCYVSAGIHDGHAVATQTGFNTLDEGELFHAGELGLTPSFGEWAGTYRAMIWTTEVDDQHGRGFALSFDQEILRGILPGAGVVPFFRYGYYYNATPSANDKVAGLSAGFQGRAIVGSSACGGCGRRGRCAV